MADLTPAERLQPSLLDRLTDLDPAQKVESRDKRVLSMQGIRDAVVRDLTWLINTTALSAVQDLSEHSEVAHSVLNFGIPEMAGLTSRSIDANELARVVKQAIVDFEPRLIAKTLNVKVDTSPSEMSGNAVTFQIDGQLWARPTPLAMHLKTEVDLDTHNAVITEGGR
jgi:type VI secretion system protein ImpF